MLLPSGSELGRERPVNAVPKRYSNRLRETDQYRGLPAGLEAHLGEYEALNERYGVSRHAYWISQPRQDPDIGVSVYEISPEGLADMRTRQWDRDSPHDGWWLEFVRRVNGIDMREHRRIVLHQSRCIPGSARAGASRRNHT